MADSTSSGLAGCRLLGGKMKLEGKDAVIEDGDLIHIRNKT